MGTSDNMSASESTTSNAAGQQAPVLGLDVHLSHGPDQFDLIVNKRLPMGGVTALFGPSGGGKTTLLRVIAGFQRAQGQVEFDGELWADEKIWVPAHQRQVGFMVSRCAPIQSSYRGRQFGLCRSTFGSKRGLEV